MPIKTVGMIVEKGIRLVHCTYIRKRLKSKEVKSLSFFYEWYFLYSFLHVLYMRRRLTGVLICTTMNFCDWRNKLDLL